MIFSFLSK